MSAYSDFTELARELTNDQNLLIKYMAVVMAAMSLIVVVLLQLVNAPYGRYASRVWGCLLPGKVAWVLQELPAFVVPVYLILFTRASQVKDVPNAILLGLFLLHYFQRTFVFPALIRGGKPTPFIPFFLAFFFCCYNGYMQGRYLTDLGHYPPEYVGDPRFLLGLFAFFTGMGINIHSDHILRNLRRPGETSYKIPRGGMFEYVSGANFFGEIMEWFGFALACSSLPAFAFALFTFCNIGPRACSHHKSYLEKFDDYPRQRKAVIPFIL